jgi:outer membrane lipoprotein-sorting protein
LLLCFLALSPANAEPRAETATATATDSARALLDAVDDLYRSDQSRARLRMEVTTPNWSRSLELEAWSKGKDLSLFRILAPKKEKGTTTLRRKNEIWNYLPKVRRVMKLPSSMMSASWMGSDFSNDDLVKESRMTRDYDFHFGDKTELDGRAVREIVCVPKPDAPVVWGQLSVIVANEADPIPIQIAYFDEDMKEARVMHFSEVQQMGDRRVPTRVVLQPSDEPDRRTIMIYEELDFVTEIPDSLFSLQSLKR